MRQRSDTLAFLVPTQLNSTGDEVKKNEVNIGARNMLIYVQRWKRRIDGLKMSRDVSTLRRFYARHDNTTAPRNVYRAPIEPDYSPGSLAPWHQHYDRRQDKRYKSK